MRANGAKTRLLLLFIKFSLIAPRLAVLYCILEQKYIGK